jgi:hypothetical protein
MREVICWELEGFGFLANFGKDMVVIEKAVE